jgi:hypothetical protein
MSPDNQSGKWDTVSLSPRIKSLRDISVNYEGHTEEVAARPPDVSARGMFINTTRNFPEGAVLNLRFRLAITGAEIRTRCEVRYCLPGVGVGVEFVGILPKAVRDIEREIKMCGRRRQPPRKKLTKTK